MDVAALSAVPVGVVWWTAPEPAITVVVKVTFSIAADGDAALASIQEPLGLDEPYAAPHQADLRHASDFAPLKARADVLLVGQVRASEPAVVLPAQLGVDHLERRFYGVASSLVTSLPLVGAYVRGGPTADSPNTSVGPRAAPAGPWRGHAPSEPCDFAAYNVAPARQQLELLRANATLRLEQLLPGAPVRQVRLPGVRPAVYYAAGREPADVADASELTMRCDTLWIDTERSICTLSWRGALVLPERHGAAAFLAVALRPRNAPHEWAELAARLPAARWVRAVEPADLSLPPAWVRPCPAARIPPGCDVLARPTTAAVRPLSPRPVTGQIDVVVDGAEPLPFVPRATAVPDLARGPAERGTPHAGMTDLLERDRILAAAALPFEPTAPTGPRDTAPPPAAPFAPTAGAMPSAAAQSFLEVEPDTLPPPPMVAPPPTAPVSPPAPPPPPERLAPYDSDPPTMAVPSAASDAGCPTVGDSALERACPATPSVPGLDEFVALRVELDSAPNAPELLEAHGMSTEQWHRLRRDWQERTKVDPELDRLLRERLGDARRAKRAARGRRPSRLG